MRAEEVPPDPCLGDSFTTLKPDFLIDEEAWGGVDIDFDTHFQKIEKDILLALKEQDTLASFLKHVATINFSVKLSNGEEIKVLNSHYSGKKLSTISCLFLHIMISSITMSY